MDATPVKQESAIQQAAPVSAPAKSWMQGPLPEIIGYVGAALVASAGLNFIAQSWERWTFPVRIGVVATAAVLLYAAAITILGLAGWRQGLQDPAKANRRRLVAVLFALAAPLVGGFGIAAISLYVAQWAEWWVPVAIAITGAGWLVIAPRVLSVPPLSEALGMAWILMFLGPAALQDLAAPFEDLSDAQIASVWVSRGLLVLLAVVALTLFARLGFDGSTMRLIAQEAKVSPGLIHHHFKDKESRLGVGRRRSHRCGDGGHGVRRAGSRMDRRSPRRRRGVARAQWSDARDPTA